MLVTTQTSRIEERTSVVILHELRKLFPRAIFGLRFGVDLAFFDQPGSKLLSFVVQAVRTTVKLGANRTETRNTELGLVDNTILPVLRSDSASSLLLLEDVSEPTINITDNQTQPFCLSSYPAFVPFCLDSCSSSCVSPSSFSSALCPVLRPKSRYRYSKQTVTFSDSAFSCPETPTATATLSKIFVFVSCLGTWTWTSVGGVMGTVSMVDSCQACRGGRSCPETCP